MPDKFIPHVDVDSKTELIWHTDVHTDARTHQPKFLDTAIDYINRGKHRRWIYGGDGIENNLEGSAGSPLDSKLTPMEELEEFIEKHMPIVDKCIGFNTVSNHSFRTLRKAGINPDYLMAKEFGFEESLPTDEIRILVDGEIEHSVIYAHGSSMATTLGGKINALDKYRLHYDGSIYLVGHFHTLMQWKMWKIKHNMYKEQAIMIGGSFMDYFNSYGQVKNYSPTPAQFGSVILNEDGSVGFNRFINDYKMKPGF